MKSSRFSNYVLLFTGLVTAALLANQAHGQNSGLHFQRPGQPVESSVVQKFRAPSQPTAQTAEQSPTVTPASVAEPAPQKVTKKVAAKPVVKQVAAPAQQTIKRDSHVRRAQSEKVEYESGAAESYQEEPIDLDTMGVQQPRRTRMAMAEPELAMGEPMMMGGPQGEMSYGHMGGCQCDACMGNISCGMCDPGCGMCDPGCGIADPGCGCADPSCGVPGCGSCVGIPGPDYWCVPICFPRLKDVTFWGGVHGFRGPRDFIPAGQSNSNFGFQEGVNLSGRAPLVGFLFPELSYQLGFQSLQSRLSGTATSSADRDQQFVTAGLFRRTEAGLQFGAVFDSMTDDLDERVTLNQVRYEVSLKTPRGRELGFWGATSTNDAVSDGVKFATIDQYNIFYRWNFKDGYQGRIWGGVSGDGEGILGADFYAPLNDRWSVQTGFNYQIPDENAGLAGVSQESWNIGIDLVWHWGRTARKGCRSPFRPLFQVADNGWMFVDRVD
jgi:hypothetical protein